MKIQRAASETSEAPAKGTKSKRWDSAVRPSSMGESGRTALDHSQGDEAASPSVVAFEYSVKFKNFKFRCGTCVHCQDCLCWQNEHNVDEIYGSCGEFYPRTYRRPSVQNCIIIP